MGTVCDCCPWVLYSFLQVTVFCFFTMKIKSYFPLISHNMKWSTGCKLGRWYLWLHKKLSHICILRSSKSKKKCSPSLCISLTPVLFYKLNDLNNRYMGAVNNTTSISNNVYRGWKYNYMFRPDPAIIRFTSKGYQRYVTTMRLCKDGEISPDDCRIRPKHVVIFSSSINIVRNTCCVIDCTHIPIINNTGYVHIT